MYSLKRLLVFTIIALSVMSVWAGRVYEATSYGVVPNTDTDMAPLVEQMLARVRTEMAGKKVILRFAPGRYHFYPDRAAKREYFISNHDQHAERSVGMAIEGFERLIVDGQGADFIFHGRMLPVSVVGTRECTLRNLSIDFETPHIAQIEVLENDPKEGITFRVAPWVNARVNDNGAFEHSDEGWVMRPQIGVAFEPDTRHIVYNTGDIAIPVHQVVRIDECTFRAPLWKNNLLPAGTVVAMRSYERPSPGIFVSHAVDTRLENVKVHYAEGMGLLAQMSENITLDGFAVCLRGDDDPRYFTTQADATHFSSCRGKIQSLNGLYEAMMDDAINVHGTYLKVVERIDDYTLRARYMHHQTWGFDWGYVGDKVQFVRSRTMEVIGGAEIVEIAECMENVPSLGELRFENWQYGCSRGVKEFVIRFGEVLPVEITSGEGYGIENLTWTPKVYFARNTIRNNRARGTLFSTPRRTVVEDNLFDHTSGTAILLCGDCNGWYETGACRDVLIRKNRFVNALTSMFQFTNAIISIYPEIPDLDSQKVCFHGGKRKAIRIINNEFSTFDRPLLYAKSVNGIQWEGNMIEHNTDFLSFHWNRSSILLERVTNVSIKDVFRDRGGEITRMELMLYE